MKFDVFKNEPIFIGYKKFGKKAGISEFTIFMWLKKGKIKGVKIGKNMQILNPAKDFGREWDKLPALLSYSKVCVFFGMDSLPESTGRALNFFEVDDNLYTDKKTLGEYIWKNVRKP